jgi:hypothetical protein
MPMSPTIVTAHTPIGNSDITRPSGPSLNAPDGCIHVIGRHGDVRDHDRRNLQITPVHTHADHREFGSNTKNYQKAIRRHFRLLT